MRYRWKSKNPNVEPRKLLLIQVDNTRSMKWPLGRIVKTHVGVDGYVRVDEVKTSTGIYKRARLAPLFLETTEVTNIEQPSAKKTNE